MLQLEVKGLFFLFQVYASCRVIHIMAMKVFNKKKKKHKGMLNAVDNNTIK